MKEIEQVKAVVNQWTDGLDCGDLEMMIATCDPEVVICNQNQPTTIGIQAVRDKYAPRIEAANFTSSFDIEHIKVYGDLALVVGFFEVETTDKSSGQKGGGTGRLVLSYRRHTDGSWKLLLDMDNNA